MIHADSPFDALGLKITRGSISATPGSVILFLGGPKRCEEWKWMEGVTVKLERSQAEALYEHLKVYLQKEATP